jgi:hypothetical protein
MDNQTPKANELLIGRNDRGEVVINHPNIQPDPGGNGYIVFSPDEADALASLLIKHASQARALRNPHYHVAKYAGEELTRECNVCGEDLMHAIHRRIELQP